mgnify:CR=1 FL=1
MPTPKNLVWQTATGIGIGNLTLASKYKTFNAAFGAGATQNVFAYFITHQTAVQWEYGTGHMADATTLVRDTVIESSNANAAVDFSNGIKNVTCDVPAEHQFVSSAIVVQTGAGPFTLTDEVWLVLNKAAPSATSIVLPAVATRMTSGLLWVVDWAGNAGDITFTPNGAETIMGLASWIVGSSGGAGLGGKICLKPSVALSGWLVLMG